MCPCRVCVVEKHIEANWSRPISIGALAKADMPRQPFKAFREPRVAAAIADDGQVNATAADGKVIIRHDPVFPHEV
jgi:hypothetical protein